MVHVRELTLAALLLTGPASALYSKSGPIQLLDPKSFDKEILQSDHAAVSTCCCAACGVKRCNLYSQLINTQIVEYVFLSNKHTIS